MLKSNSTACKNLLTTGSSKKKVYPRQVTTILIVGKQTIRKFTFISKRAASALPCQSTVAVGSVFFTQPFEMGLPGKHSHMLTTFFSLLLLTPDRKQGSFISWVIGVVHQSEEGAHSRAVTLESWNKQIHTSARLAYPFYSVQDLYPWDTSATLKTPLQTHLEGEFVS